MGSQVTWSEEIIEFAPFCLRRNRARPEEGLLLEVLDDYWDENTQTQYVRLKIVKTGKEIERSFLWIKETCEKLNEMEVLAWASK